MFFYGIIYPQDMLMSMDRMKITVNNTLVKYAYLINSGTKECMSVSLSNEMTHLF
jgi:hypothetical protein